MKTCPECGTQYEDHVATCLVDGADLAGVVATSAVPTPQASAPVVTTLAPAPASNRGGAMIAIVAGIVLLLVLAGMAGVVVVLMSTGAPDRPAPAPAPEPAVPVPTPEPPPVPLPEPEGDEILVNLTTVPTGVERGGVGGQHQAVRDTSHSFRIHDLRLST